MQRKIAIICVLALAYKPSLQDLHHSSGIPESTIKRQLAALRDEFGMRITFIRDTQGERGAAGYYVLEDWGIIHQATFMKRYGHL